VTPSERRERLAGLTRDQRVIFNRLNRRSEPVTIPHDLAKARLKARYGFAWPMGYDRAYAACQRLVKLGLVRRLPGRPSRWEVVR